MEVLLVDEAEAAGVEKPPKHMDVVSEVFEPQAVLFLGDSLRREALAQELGNSNFRSVQVDDLVTAYAIVTRLMPELMLVDPSMCFESNWKDLEALRKFTLEEDCAMMVLIASPSSLLIRRLADLDVDHVSLCTDPVSLLALTIRRIVMRRREVRRLREAMPLA